MSNSFFSLQKYADFVKKKCRFCEEIIKNLSEVCAYHEKEVILQP